MLEQVNLASLVEVIDRLPCAVELPPDLNGEMLSQPTAARVGRDQRRYPRFACRGVHGRAALELFQSLPAVPRKQLACRIVTLDLSRGGLRFLHSEPLFAGERMRVTFPNGKRRYLQVKWCRRLGERCFAIGTDFAERPQHNAARTPRDRHPRLWRACA